MSKKIINISSAVQQVGNKQIKPGSAYVVSNKVFSQMRRLNSSHFTVIDLKDEDLEADLTEVANAELEALELQKKLKEELAAKEAKEQAELEAKLAKEAAELAEKLAKEQAELKAKAEHDAYLAELAALEEEESKDNQ